MVRPEEVLDFATLYKANCAACHGENGRNGAAISLANPAYLAVVGEENLREIAAKGVPGKLMPPFAKSAGGMLTDQQIDVLAHGMMQEWSRPDLFSGQNIPPYKATVPGDVVRGKQAFGVFCARCHGVAGEGEIRGGVGSIVDGTYLALISDQSLRSLTIAGRPDEGMPDWRADGAQPMTDQQITDIVAWLASKRTTNPGQPYPTHAMNEFDSESREIAGADAMDPMEQNTQDGQPVRDEPESVRSAKHSRRAFLFKLSLLANGAVGAVLAVPILGYFFGPAMKKGSSYNSWIALGPVNDFPEGETRLVNYRNPVTTMWDGQTGDVPCWVRRVSGTTFQVFAINCAHLGCPVRWFAQSQLFLCPCHGGAYYADGSRASGPPERGLFEYEHKVVDGSLMISAGKMPTLANEASVEPPLTQIVGADSAERLMALERSKPRCGSCQS